MALVLPLSLDTLIISLLVRTDSIIKNVSHFIIGYFISMTWVWYFQDLVILFSLQYYYLYYYHFMFWLFYFHYSIVIAVLMIIISMA